MHKDKNLVYTQFSQLLHNTLNTIVRNVEHNLKSKGKLEQ